jgi:hypothetical protein
MGSSNNVGSIAGLTMKSSNITSLKRNVMRRSSSLIAPVLLIAAGLMIGNESIAGEPGYRVVLGSVPGADEIEAGNIRAAIKILEDQLDQVEPENSGAIWATLCAAYIADISLYKAERACTKAVEIEPTNHALNNRGVFRVYDGNLMGAREDFDRVRTLNVKAYPDKLKTTNVRLVAAGNFDLVKQLLAKRTDQQGKSSGVVSTAAIEDLMC